MSSRERARYEHGYRLVSDLIPYARNARQHSDAQVSQIAGAIREFGFTNPVLIDESDGIIAGHGRILAARKLKMTEVPCVVIPGLSPAQKQALILADNKLALNATWDNDMLVMELGELAEDGFDLNIVGFNQEEMDALICGTSMDPEGAIDGEDDVPEPPAIPVSVEGDVWILGDRHRLVCGDCTVPDVVDKALGGVKPHLMVTDPPYGFEYDPSWRNGLDKVKRSQGRVKNDARADWREAYALFPGDVAYVWHNGLKADVVAAGLTDCGFFLRSQIVWVKPHFALGRGDYHVQHESCFYAVKKTAKGHWNGSRTQSTVWQIANGTFQGGKAKPEDEKSGHGTQKPVECMRRPIENNSSPGQSVYEPFCGSGTTIIAAETTSRVCHAVELNPQYVDVAIKRFQKLTGKTVVLEGDGRSFDQIDEARRK